MTTLQEKIEERARQEAEERVNATFEPVRRFCHQNVPDQIRVEAGNYNVFTLLSIVQGAVKEVLVERMVTQLVERVAVNILKETP